MALVVTFSLESKPISAHANQLAWFDLDGGDGGGGSGNYYIPETWTSRINYIRQSEVELVDTIFYDKYVFPWHRNYHRIKTYFDGYNDMYVEERLHSIFYNSGALIITLESGVEISSSKLHGFEISPQFQSSSIGKYSNQSSYTVTEVIGGSITITLGGDLPSGSYGFYAINYRSRYTIYHHKSRSNQNYDQLVNAYEDVYLYDYYRPDIIFIYSGISPLV